MAYQHTLSNHHQSNASNPGWQSFTLHLQVPSLLIVVFISHTHTHTPLLHLHTVLHCHIVLHIWQSYTIFLYIDIYFYAPWLVPMHDNAQFDVYYRNSSSTVIARQNIVLSIRQLIVIAVALA